MGVPLDANLSGMVYPLAIVPILGDESLHTLHLTESLLEVAYYYHHATKN